MRITGIVYLPEWAGDPVASPMLRNLPTSRIEAAINRRQFAVTGASRFEGGTMTMPSGRTLRSADVMKPLGNPKRTPDFYEVVALQHTRLVDDGEPNPTARMARAQPRAALDRTGLGRPRPPQRTTPAWTPRPRRVRVRIVRARRSRTRAWCACQTVVCPWHGRASTSTVRPPPRAGQGEVAVLRLLGRDRCVADCPNAWVRCAGLRLPGSTEDAVAVRSEKPHVTGVCAERVGESCLRRRGRPIRPTALAVHAVASSVPAAATVEWVRANYHPRAVETRRQRAWIATVASSLS